MKLISWNINGLRAGVKKGLADFVHKEQADAYCFQEIKMIDRDVHASVGIFMAAHSALLAVFRLI